MPRNSMPGPRSGEPLAGESSLARKRVLVADDQARILDVTAEMLEDSFDIVGLVSNGPAALESALKLEPDLAVLDISMPGMTGIEVARGLRKRGNRTKIVFLTVYEDAEILSSCLAAGGLGYVVKQAMESDLIPAIHAALDGRVFVSRFSSDERTH